MATHYQINHSDVPIRLFKSDFLEFFTHITPVAVVIIWLPVAMYFMWRGIQEQADAHLLFAFVAGLFLWTFTEYTMHRFVFHFKPRTPEQEKIIFLFHGIHHAQPQLKTRLVMPPVVSVPLAFVMYSLLILIFGIVFNAPHWIAPAFSGVVIGYLVYDLTHYATHHWPMRWGFLKALKQHHMKHHYKTEDMRFGVSSPLWDYVFHTMPTD